MKNLLLCVFLLSIINISNGQVHTDDLLAKGDSEVIYLDGSVERGEVEGFLFKRVLDFNPQNPFKTVERQLKLTDKKIYLTDSVGNKKKIYSDSLQSIKLVFQDEVIHYRRFNSKTVNVKGEIIDLNRKIWLPYLVKGQINILSFSLVDTKENYAGTYAYLNREGEDFVINPVDFNRINIFNFWKTDDKAKVAMKETFRDCPETLAFIDQYFEKAKEDGMKPFKKEKKLRTKEISKLPKSERKKALRKFYKEVMLRPYMKALENYNKSCSH